MELIIEWDFEKNDRLLKERKVSFEMVVASIESDKVLGIEANKSPRGHQQLLVIVINDYTYVVSFVKDGGKIFLKTIYPSRKFYKKYYENEK